jgi:hypothetical protein
MNITDGGVDAMRHIDGATGALATTGDLPYQAIATTTPPPDPLPSLLEAVFDLLVKGFDAKPFLGGDTLDGIFLDAAHSPHDALVGVNSATAGAADGKTFSGWVHTDELIAALLKLGLPLETRGQMASADVHRQVVCWLTDTVCPGSPALAPSLAQSSVASVPVTPLAAIDLSAMPRVGEDIVELDPPPGSTLQSTVSHPISVTAAKEISRVVFVLESSTIIDRPVAPFAVTVVPRTTGSISLLVLVLFADGTYTDVAASYYVMPTGGLLFLRVDAEAVALSRVGSSYQLQVIGFYTETVGVDVRNVAQFVVRSGTEAVIKVLPGGRLVAQGAGSDVVEVWLDGVMVPVVVHVDDASDTTPPDTSLIEGPSGTIPGTAVTFVWIGADDTTPVGGLVYASRLAPLEAAFSAFTSATTRAVSNLSPGSYTLYVKARDAAGNEDPSPVSRSFTVSGPPVLEDAGPATLWLGGATPQDATLKVDLKVILKHKGQETAVAKVALGKAKGLSPGSPDFGGATLVSAPMTLVAAPPVEPGDKLIVVVKARVSCSGSGGAAGTVRLWHDGAPVDAGPGRAPGARIPLAWGDVAPTYFLRSGGQLSPQAGSAAASLDAPVSGPCGAFVPIAKWKGTVP